MIIAITNLKGGVGKSTLSRNLAVYFAQSGAKTCIIDTDIEQRTTCDWRNRREEELTIDVFPMSSVEGLVQDINTHKANGYQVIILDGVPQLEEVTTKMILLANFLLIPITPSIDDLSSFQRFLKRYEAAKTVRSSIPAFLVLNRYSKTGEAEEMKQALPVFKKHGIATLDTVITERVAHKRSSKHGLTALEYTDQKAKAEILALCQELESKFIRQEVA